MVQTHCPKCNVVLIHTEDECPKCGAKIPREHDAVSECEEKKRDAAEWQPRLGAYIFDLVVFIFIVGAGLNVLMGSPFGSVIVSTILIYLYFVLFDYFLGRSPGKMFVGLEIVRSDGKKPELADVLIESIGKIPILLPFDIIMGIYDDRCGGLRFTSHLAGITSEGRCPGYSGYITETV